ncbi:acyl-coenzyme A thioesterase 1-like isoform X2 [Salvelinus fontinalis]|uniref:acyl-coenzyme A thioesterase 1-like isoform X2 n=1 Tax=Salvelinus fontinalis TaxID=8038 RepID=UPI0024859CE2|nr:acyl-coenzyme A thioesterase 1-like isoform X2 [Salvelinus fontinalis]
MLHQRAYREVISKLWFIRFQTTGLNSQQVCVRLLPSPRCFFDEPVHVKVDGLSPHQKVELRSKLKDDKGVIFRASALVAADASGQVDLCRSPSLGGSYTGVESMGLFWAMAAETPHSKLLKKNVLGSMTVDIEVLHGDTGELLATETNERRFMADGVQGPGIGILSISKSGDLALSMASFLSGISATAWINGSNANTVAPLHYKDLIIPSITPIVENVTFSPSGILDIRDALPDPETEGNRGSVIPIERSNSRFLFAASEDDRNWNSCLFAQQAAARLRHHGKENFEVVMYPRAGHFLEVPYMPHCPSGFHSAVGQVVVFGGEAKAHHQAQLDLWRRVQEFFRKHLDRNNTAQKAMLYTRG